MLKICISFTVEPVSMTTIEQKTLANAYCFDRISQFLHKKYNEICGILVKKQGMLGQEMLTKFKLQVPCKMYLSKGNTKV